MQKKKSYMNTNSILSEGIFDELLEPFIPKDMKDKIRKSLSYFEYSSNTVSFILLLIGEEIRCSKIVNL